MKFYSLPLPANASNRGDIAEQNFRQESRKIIECFWRELVQNFLDIDMKKEIGPVKKLHIHVIPNDDIPNIRYLNSLLEKPEKWTKNTEKDTRQPKASSKYGLLVIEEENTVGICGRLDPNEIKPEDEDQESEYWENFWFSDGISAKTGTKGGRRGQGKATYHAVSKFRTVFAITKRATDDKTLLFGKCRLERTFVEDGIRHDHYGLFGSAIDPSKDVVKPIDNDGDIAKFEKKLKIPHRGDYGTTWIFPFVDLEKFEFGPILKILAKEYCYAFAAGKLSVEYCTDGIIIDALTLPKLVEEYRLQEPTSDKIEFIQECATMPDDSIYPASEEWSSDGDINHQMNPEAFTETKLDEFRQLFEDEEIIALSLPIEVKPRNGTSQDSKIKVFLKKSEKLHKTDEQIIRSSLLIASEKHLRNIPGKFYGLVVADDAPISALLSESENPSHLKFNVSNKTAKEKYENVAGVIQLVRHALPWLVRLLGFSEKPDKNALVSLLYVYDNDGKPGGVGKEPSDPESSGEPPEPPDSGLSVFKCDQNKDKFIVRKNPESLSNVPNKILMKFGYETGYGIGDPIVNWSIFDFDLGDESRYPIKVNNDVKLIRSFENQIEIECTGKDPRVEVIGFSEFTRVHVKIYEV